MSRNTKDMDRNDGLGLDEYQQLSKKYDTFTIDEVVIELGETGFIEKVLGLTGEAGEVADKVKKILRDRDGAMAEEDVANISKELGDVLWYLAAVARYLGLSLEEVGRENLEKLESRYRRDAIHGEGDER